MGRYPEKRRQALEATMQQEVFRVASEILRADGPDALTMDRIAREVGVSRATLYNYFADADTVMSFVEAKTFEPVSEEVDRIVAGSAPARDKLEAIARVVLDSLYEDRALVMALFSKKELHGPRADQKRQNRKRFLDLVQAVMAAGSEEGSLRKLPQPLAAEIFLGALTGMIDSMVYAGEFKTADEVVPGLMDILASGLAARCRPGG